MLRGIRVAMPIVTSAFRLSPLSHLCPCCTVATFLSSLPNLHTSLKWCKVAPLLHLHHDFITPSSPHAQLTNSAITKSSKPFNFEAAAPHSVDRGKGVCVLGIETSCDDTCAAVVRADGRILGESQVSQAHMLAHYGGVVPMLAQELHAQCIEKVVDEALANAKVLETELSAVAVTIGPGISPCLRVGVTKARSIARVNRLPLIGVHHMEAHALVARIFEDALHFPFVVLLISGGHNLLLVAQNVGQYVQLGTTVDDAIGEAFDKTARLLALDLRKGGGPALEEIALEGNPDSFSFSVPMRHQKHCNFSYAGLKNQVRLVVQSHITKNVSMSVASDEDRQFRADIAASFQKVAVLHLEDRCRRAIEWSRKIDPTVSSLVVSGGVASNKVVRARLGTVAMEHGLQLICPPPQLCTDNGVMVAWAGIEHFRLGNFSPPPPLNEPADAWLDLRPRWQLGEVYAEGISKAPSLKSSGGIPSLTAQVQALLRNSQ